jgi:heptaprenyl diphosphate synthase
VRFGLANIAVLVALAVLGEKSALAVSVLRVGIVGLATGTLFGPVSVLAVSGALASWAAMVLAFRSSARFTFVGISIAGASAHVTAQFVAAAFLSGTTGVLAFAAIPIIASLLFGIATGFAARYIISRLEGNGLAGR